MDITIEEIEVDDAPKLRCPRCQNTTSFDIDITATIRLARTGLWEPMDAEVEDGNLCVCLTCGSQDKLRHFTQD